MVAGEIQQNNEPKSIILFDPNRQDIFRDRLESKETFSGNILENNLNELPKSFSNGVQHVTSELSTTESGGIVEKVEVEIPLDEVREEIPLDEVRKEKIVAFGSVFGDLSTEIQEKINNFNLEQYQEVYKYVDGPGPVRNQESDLISWTEDDEGNITGMIGIERRMGPDSDQIFYNIDHKSEDAFSSHTFFENAFTVDNFIDHGIDISGIPTFSVGEITRFLLRGHPRLDRRVRAILKPILATSISNNIARYNVANPDTEIKYCIGNVMMTGGAYEHIKRFLPSAISVNGSNSNLLIRDSAKEEDDPHGLGYASPYMKDDKAQPRSHEGKPFGLGIFIADISNLDSIIQNVQSASEDLIGMAYSKRKRTS